MADNDCYIGRRPGCGCIAFWISDSIPDTGYVANSVRIAIKDGLVVERAVTADVRTPEAKWECAQCAKPKEPKQEELFPARGERAQERFVPGGPSL